MYTYRRINIESKVENCNGELMAIQQKNHCRALYPVCMHVHCVNVYYKTLRKIDLCEIIQSFLAAFKATTIWVLLLLGC